MGVEGERILLRDLRESDVGEAYLRWMNDPEVTHFLESRFERHTPESLRGFVARHARDPGHRLFAITLRQGGRHIGNLKLGPIEERHRRAEIGLLVGERDCWGKGFATEAISLATEYAFRELGLRKVTAGCYAPNEGSLRAFRRAGFAIEGVRKEHCLLDGAFVDLVLLGRIASEKEA